MNKNDERKHRAQSANPAALFPISGDMSLDQIMARLREELEGQQQAGVGRGTSSPAGGPEPQVVSELSLEEIMRRVKVELSRRRTSSARAASQPAPERPTDYVSLPRWEPFVSRLPVRREYALGDLLQFSDADFIDTAYRVTLRRPADPNGRGYYLEALRTGALSKVEILGLIRFSDEGMRHSVHIDGLLLPYKLHKWSRIPVLGSVLGFAMAVYRLPRLATRLSAIETSAARESQSIGQLLNGIDDSLEAQFADIGITMRALAKRAELMQSEMAKMEDIRTIFTRLDTLEMSAKAQGDALRAYKAEHEQQEQELRECLSEQSEAIANLGEELRAYMSEREQHEHELRQRLSGQSEATAHLGEELRAYMSEREQHEHELRQRLSEQGEATAHLGKELRAFQAEREQHEHELRRRLSEQSDATAHLGKELRAHRVECEHPERGLRQRLSEQGETTAYLAEELRAYMSEREQHEHELRQRLSEKGVATALLGEELRAYMSEREQHEHELRQRLSEQAEATAHLGEELRSYRVEREQHEHELRQRLNEQGSTTALLGKNTLENRRSLLDVQRRLMTFLDTAVGRVYEGAERAITDETSAGDQILNAQYVSFEDAFRGEREDIKTRAAHYLETLAAAGIEKGSGVVLDLGCGRGEWLEVLTEAGYHCRGVDLNNVMLGDSLARGFDVVEADVVDYLRSLEDNSLAAITSMHLVEHLPHNILIRLLDEAIRVLRPGGVLILETPNPENVTVGACFFYLDPTHRNPIPPALLQWIVQERGFMSPVIERLSEHRGVAAIAPVSADMPGAVQINQMIEWFTASPDYAVIARKS